MSADIIAKEKIERAKIRVEASGIDQTRRDELLDLLDHAEHISNGGGKSIEDIAKAVAAHMRAYVNDSLEQAKRCAACAPTLSGWRGMVLQAKWPLALFASVAVFSPNFPQIAALIEKLVK